MLSPVPMGGMPGPGAGASPAPMAGPPGGTGGAMAPGPMPGAQAAAMGHVKLAVEALQKALPQLPMGSDLHAAILNAVSGITKHMDDSGIPPASHEDAMQQLVALARQGQQGANPLASMMPGASPAGAPPAPPPGA